MAGGWGFFVRAHRNSTEWVSEVVRAQVHLDNSVHGCMSEAGRKYRRKWRKAGHTICRLHALGDERADELDPQPGRLDVMWNIW